MKIPTNLRLAVKLICEQRNRHSGHAWSEYEKDIRDWYKKTPDLRRAVAKCAGLKETLDAELKKINSEWGVVVTGYPKGRVGIVKRATAEARGFRSTVQTGTLNYLGLIAQIAQATPEEGEKILASIGIKWQ